MSTITVVEPRRSMPLMRLRRPPWRRLGPMMGGPGRRARLLQLFVGLVLFGVSIALMVDAQLGVGAWDVLHQGLARRTGLSFGTVVVAVSVAAVLAWVPLRERPGLGTISNVLVVGVIADLALAAVPGPDVLAGRAGLLLAGVVLNAVATALYIGAGLGPGPRDGLMTGLARRSGRPIGLVRTSIEVVVLVAGWVLGGVVGIGTVIYAVSIGPLVQYLLPKLSIDDAQKGDDHG